MRSRVLVVAALVAVVLAAPAAALTRRHTSAGNALAARALLVRSDLPRGWRVSAPAPASEAPLGCARFHPPTPGVVEDGAASTPTFSAGSSGPLVSQNAYAYATAGEQATLWRRVIKPAMIRCIEAAVVHGSSGGVHFTVVGGRPLALPGLGVEARGYRVRATANTTNQSVDVYVDVIVLGRGRIDTGVNFASFEQPLARSFELRLARIVARRLSSA